VAADSGSSGGSAQAVPAAAVGMAVSPSGGNANPATSIPGTIWGGAGLSGPGHSLALAKAMLSTPTSTSPAAGASAFAGFADAGHAQPGGPHTPTPLSHPEDGGGGSNTSPIASFQGNGITTSDDLWWFNGETPANYSTRVTLTASSGGSSDSYSWIITSGGGTVVQFSDGSLSTGGTGMNTVQLVSVDASAAAQTLTFDVSIWLGINGNDAGVAYLAVPTPDHLVSTGNTDKVDASYFYKSQLFYKIEDQFNRVLPRNVEINEQWTSGVVNDFAGANWRRDDPMPATVNPANWDDGIQGETARMFPVPQNPQNPLGNTKIQHWGQAWYVGSLVIGKGVKVQTNTLQKYRDHARHESITSPP
jgi:hypothetical protein